MRCAPTCRLWPWAWLFVAAVPSAPQSPAAPQAYFVLGYHGGYYLTGEEEYRRCLDKLFGLLAADPNLRIVLELEPYTLDAMKQGERFDCERHGRSEPVLSGWSVSPKGVTRLAEAAHEGSFGMRLANADAPYVNLCQPLPAADLRGRTLTFSAWARARRGEGVHLYIDAWSAHGFIPGSAVRTERLSPDGKWHTLSLTFSAPTDAQTIFPQAKIDGPGEGDFDALSLVDGQGTELLTNGGFEVTVTPSLKDEARLAKLRQWCETGRLEVVGGAYTQPILYTIGDESAARQFAYGVRAVKDALGLPVGAYAAQEPGMSGQVPQLARAVGIEEALYRTHWCIFGSPPPRDATVVWWAGPDGTRLPAVPAYVFTPLMGYGLPGSPTPQYVAAAQAAGVAAPLFTSFADLVSSAIPDETTSLTSGRFASGWANLCQAVPVGDLAGRRLLLSGRLRARKPGGHLYIDAHTPEHVALGGVQSGNAPADGQWRRVEIGFTVPAGTVTMFPQARVIAAEGDMDVADLSLTVADDKRELLPTPLVQGNELGPGWGVGKSEGVEAKATVGEDGGRRFACLHAQAPAVSARVTTLRQYFAVAGEPKTMWADAYRGFEHRFPWGLLAGRPQRMDRLAEDVVVGTERLLAMAGKRPVAELDDAWRLVLMQEHHDGWVCAPVLFGVWRGYDSYAAMCAASAKEAIDRCAQLTGSLTASATGREITVPNPCGHERSNVVDLEAELPAGTVHIPQIVDSKGLPAPAAVSVTSTHPDGSAKTVVGRFIASAPSMGYARYEVTDRRAAAEAPLPGPELSLSAGREGLFEVTRAGSEPSPISGPLRLAGHFPTGDEWDHAATQEAPATPGASLSTRGDIGGIPYECVAEASPTSPLVRFTLTLDFGDGADVGATEDSERLPKWAKADQKLRLVVPLPYAQPRFFAHEPFEVREATTERCHCIRYAIAQGETEGLAVFTDRATDVTCRRSPASLEITLGYGGGFIYAPGEHASLTGREVYQLALLFYRGDWASARVPEVADDLAHPLLTVVGGKAEASSGPRLVVEPPGAAVVTAFWPTGKGVAARLWRPYPGEADVQVRVTGARGLFRADLAAEPSERLSSNEAVSLRLSQGQIVTLTAPMP
jgi:hypothetical protein